MKKFLSLVLALVMTMSLVTIAGAKDFTDDSKITYKEAVDVMSDVDVVDGYANGEFQPTATLTRGAAAKIICNMILGPTTADALIADAAPFKDVPADHVFAGYIAYCAEMGIINGYADGTFRPAGTLNGYSFMKMLLGALGYDGAVEGYTGANWSINVAKRALNLKLNDGNDAFVGSAAVTREEACLYAFNTLNTKMVEYPNNTTITVGDVNVTTTSKASETILFRYEYFEDLNKSGARTEAGRPAHTWKIDRDEIGTYADTPDYVLVLDDNYSQKTDALEVIRDLTDNDDLVYSYNEAGKQITNLYINGKNCNGDAEAAAAAAVNGNVVEIYADKYDAIEDVVAFTYKLKKIEKVSTTLTKAQKDDGNTCKVTFENGKKNVLDTDIVGFDADTYVEGAYILVCENDAWAEDESEIIDSVVAETVEGTVEYIKGSKITVDGVDYKYLAEDEIDVEAEGTFYLNLAGQIIKASTDAKSTNYAYIYAVNDDDEAKNEDGLTARVVTAYVVLADGTKASYTVASDYADAIVAAEDTVIAYEINSDDELEKATAKYEPEFVKGMNVDKKNAAGTDPATEFIFTYVKDNKQKVDLATGYKNVDFTSDAWVVANDDGDVLYVFVPNKGENVNSEAELAVIANATPAQGKNADGDRIWVYDVIVGESATTLTFKDSLGVVAAGDVIAFEMDGDYAKTADTTLYEVEKVSAANEGYFIGVGDAQINLGTETVYTITVEWETTEAYEKNEAPEVSVDEVGTVAKDDNVIYTLDSNGDIDVVFIVELVY